MSEYQAVLRQPTDGRMPVIGCHLSSAKGYAAMAKTAASIDANTFAFFTRNPRGGKAKAIDDADVKAFAEEAALAGIGRIVAHGSYTVNPCAAKEQVRSFAFQALAEDLARMERTPGQLLNIHPGSHVGQGADVGIELIAEVLNTVLTPEQTTTLLLETMAGKGSEVGRSFEELRAILDRVQLAEKMGVCLDTCHIWDAGYNIAEDLDGVLTQFDKVIGLDKLYAVHLNASMNPCGAHKDRHQKLGQGYIGLEALVRVINHPALKHLPFILETPNEDDGYAAEIALMRERAE